MIINEEGTYTLIYTATDSCGKSVEAERELIVADTSPRRTVLYTDGTLIINEKQTDEAHNIELHGVATNVYTPFIENSTDPIERYEFNSDNQSPWYNERQSVTSVYIGSQISPKQTRHWFYDFRNCTAIDVSKLDTSEVTTMLQMFNGCYVLNTLDVSHFDTSNVTDMTRMFSGCRALTSLDVTHFNTSNVTNMNSMFSSCRALTSLDVTHFNTSNVTNMNSMFNDCQSLTSLDVSHFDTSNVTSMQSMFNQCYALTTLDCSSFDTRKVTSMNQMFRVCKALKTLDISSFETPLVTNTASMFNNSSVLETIYVGSGFDISNLSSGVTDTMFTKTNMLVGGAGTTWSSSNPVDKTYAHIDGGTSNPGYFTAKS